MKTLVCSPSLNVAVSGSTPLADTDWPLNPLLDQLAKSAQDELSGEIATNIVLKSQIESVRPDRLEMADGSLKLGIWIEGNSQISLR